MSIETKGIECRTCGSTIDLENLDIDKFRREHRAICVPENVNVLLYEFKPVILTQKYKINLDYNQN